MNVCIYINTYKYMYIYIYKWGEIPMYNWLITSYNPLSNLDADPEDSTLTFLRVGLERVLLSQMMTLMKIFPACFRSRLRASIADWFHPIQNGVEPHPVSCWYSHFLLLDFVVLSVQCLILNFGINSRKLPLFHNEIIWNHHVWWLNPNLSCSPILGA